MAKVLTEDEARRIASNIAKLPTCSANPSAPSLFSFSSRVLQDWWSADR